MRKTPLNAKNVSGIEQTAITIQKISPPSFLFPLTQMPKERPSGGKIQAAVSRGLRCVHLLSLKPSLGYLEREEGAWPNVLDFEFEQEYFLCTK